MFHGIRKYLKDSGGNMAMMMALAGFPLCIAVGAAVDYSRASSAKSAIQAATDAAALAAATDFNLSKSKVEELVAQYLAANGIDKALAHVNEINVEYDKSTGTVSVRVGGKLDTSLMQLAGIADMDISGISQVQVGGSPLELALVLDNTFSMSANGKLMSLKSASTALINELYRSNSGTSDVKTSIIPFANYVNVGIDHRNEPWLDVIPDQTVTRTGAQWEATNCRSVPIDAVPGTSKEVCDWNPTGPQITYTRDEFWEGCVGSRDFGLDTSIGSISTRYVGLINNSDWDSVVCVQPITPLTNNAAKLRTDINSMNVTHNLRGRLFDPGQSPETYIPAGMLWGWNVLDSEQPLTGARTQSQMVADKAKKVLILMTDGDNTLAPDYSAHTHYSESESPTRGEIANGLTNQLCSNIKGAGITIYTVSLEVTDPVSLEMLTNCASAPSMAFNANDSAGLVAAFKDIARDLVALHIAK